MASIDKISGVSYSSISKVGTTLKANIQKVSGVDTPPTCTTKTFGYDYKTPAVACDQYGTGTTSTYYWDESTGYLYSDSCGGTEAAEGYYADGDGFRFYNVTSHTLSNVLGACRSDRRLKHNIVFKEYSESNIPIYEFEYINKSDGIGTYVGTMAQDLIKLGMHEAVALDNDGYYSVHYNKIDVDFRKV